MFERGFCRMCGETQSADERGLTTYHEPRGSRIPCEGAGEPLADSPEITFWRASSGADSWIIVSRGADHALEMMGDAGARLKFDLVNEEIASLIPGEILTGQVTVDFEGFRMWRVGTIATEIRR